MMLKHKRHARGWPLVRGVLLLSVSAVPWAAAADVTATGAGRSAASATAFATAFATATIIESGGGASSDSAEGDDAGPYAQKRLQFNEALDALASGDQARFAALNAALSDYPLADFLAFEQLQQQWRDVVPGSAEIDQLNAFEQRTGDSSLTRRLTRVLQNRFAETEQWNTFLALGKSRLAAKMTCDTLKARSETGQVDGFDEQIIEMWVKPLKHREPCKSILEDIEARQTPPVPAIWERIYQAMESNKPEFARPMLSYLGSRDRNLVKAWIEADESPQSFLLSGKLDKDTLLNRRIIADLILDWSREDTSAAIGQWLRIRERFSFNAERYYDTSRALAMRAAYRRMPEAYQWLQTFTARADDLELQEWRIRTALLAEDWQAVMSSIAQLPREEQEEDHWAYWQARALEQLDRAAEARAIYAELAGLQSYHGFLAADRLQLDYAIYDEPIVPETTLLARLADEPALIRAREFHHVGLRTESRREWNNWVRGKSESELAAAAVLGSNWELHDRAIYAAGLSNNRRAISLRFPLLYRSEVARASVDNAIEPAWIFGVMRRESAYIQDVRSGAGAVGLMQLMPRTARYVAGLQGKKDWQGDLTDSDINIELGTFYLRHVMNRFNDHQVLATASYNAGPSRVGKWLQEGSMEADIWIDTIPYTETRRYVRAVLAYAAIYEQQLTGKPQRLSNKLLPIPAASGV